MHMKYLPLGLRLSVAAAVLLLSPGCSTLTPRERHGLEIAGAIVIAGAIAGSQAHHGERAPETQAYRTPGPMVRP